MLSSTYETLAPAEPVLLSPLESIFWHLEKSFVGSFRMTLVMRLDGCIEADILMPALHRLQRRHPRLRATIIKGSDDRLRYQFNQGTPSISFDITDYDEGEFPWREAAHRLMQSGFPIAGPLVEVKVLRSRSRRRSDLLLTAHHAIADGVSALMLVEDLLTEYARGEKDPDVLPRPVLPSVTPIRTKSSAGWLGWLCLIRRLRRMMRMDRSLRQTPLPETHGIPPQSQWVHWVFSREDTLKLVRRCRREQVSLGAVLVAAAFCGLIDCLPVSEALFKCTFPFDLRKAHKRPEEPVDLGCFASMMNEFYEVRQQPAFWDLARRAHQNHQTFVKNGGPSFYYNLAALAVFYYRLKAAAGRIKRAVAGSEPPNGKRVTLLATHYGVLNLREAYGSLRPQACTVTLKNDTIGPSTLFEALVIGQRLNVSFVADCLEPAFWEQLQVAVRQRLDAAISTSEPSLSG